MSDFQYCAIKNVLHPKTILISVLRQVLTIYNFLAVFFVHPCNMNMNEIKNRHVKKDKNARTCTYL